MSDRLTIAVPRGALSADTLDLLDGLGIDTAEVRSNDRKLLFEDVGIVTMRPSDVPTYVEHGSADIGITGKDVLLEQSSRKVYELLDLGYGRCEMVVAAPDRGDPIADALRRLGRVRIATKYPRVAAEHFAETGRQAEIVEVKGSVELAPLTGLVDGIVDLTASGKTLAENNLRVMEQIATCTARLIANPVAHKLKARADRLDPGADPGMRIVTRRERLHAPRARSPATSSDRRARSSTRSRARRRRGRSRLHRALRPCRARRRSSCAWIRSELEASVGVLEPDVLDGLRTAIANVRAVAQAQLRRARDGRAPGGHTRSRSSERARAPGGDLRAGRAGAVPVDGRHGRRHRARRGRRADRRVRAARAGRSRAPGDPRRLRPLRGHRGVPDGRRAGDRRARVRHGVRRRGRRDRRTRATRTCRRPSARWPGRRLGSTGSRGRASSRSWPPAAAPTRS